MADKKVLAAAVDDPQTQRCLRALQQDANELRALIEALTTRLTELEATVAALP